jgi:alanine dehydrogenase
LNTHKGQVVYPAVAEAFNMPLTKLEDVLA